MKLSTMLMYDGNPRSAADQVTAWEKAGLDTVWVAEAYGFDSPTLMGYLAAKTETVEIGSAILNIYSRTPGALLQTAAGLDNVTAGRALLGLGASGPQVIEGFHGVPYAKPLARTKEVIDIIRSGMRREPLTADGIFQLPLDKEHGAVTGLGKPLKLLTRPERDSIPIYVAALGPKNVEQAAEIADGWLPHLFWPEKFGTVWGDAIKAGYAKRDASLGPSMQIHAGGRRYLHREPLQHLLGRLDPARFLRIHRGVAVNVERIAEVHPLFQGNAEVVLRDGTRLGLSRRFRAAASAALGLG